MMRTLNRFKVPAIIQNYPLNFLKLHVMIIRTIRIICQEDALPHVKSNRKKAVPQDKNLTLRKIKIPGITLYRSTYGVKFERKTEAYQG